MRNRKHISMAPEGAYKSAVEATMRRLDVASSYHQILGIERDELERRYAIRTRENCLVWWEQLDRLQGLPLGTMLRLWVYR